MISKVGKFRKEPKSNAGRLSIPAHLVSDSQFPLVEGRVMITIEGKHLIIYQVDDRT